MRYSVLWLLVTLCLAAACAPVAGSTTVTATPTTGTPPTPAGSTRTTLTPTVEPSPVHAMPTVPVPTLDSATTPAPPTGPAVQMTERAAADLAARLEIAPSVVEVVSTHREEMPLQGLGCPTTDVENPGTREKSTPVLPAFIMAQVIRLQAVDTIYEYHAGGGQLIFCGAVDG